MSAATERLSPGDPNSFSRPDLCAVIKIDLSLSINFELKILSGHADFTVEKKSDDVKTLILDSRDLDIKNVSVAGSYEELRYTLDKPTSTFGSKLEIVLPADSGKRCVVRIQYDTSNQSSALQWLTPNQTAGKKLPYLFSQCQAIHARSMLPCQDTPSVKCPYTAKITSPKDLVVLMSAERDGQESLEDGKILFKFNQKVPIPSYLLAIVAGALESRRLGPRSCVWSEKEFVDKAEFEFSETEQMLAKAEELMGTYVWGIYDLLVLPPSFPFGGMENPCLTFVTPTLLAGDRSLAGVVAHEIAHSWTGNLVTNCNFEHFWLNEGFTVFVERKILGRLQNESFRQFQALEGWKELQYAVDTQGSDNPLTNLVVDLTGVDPDDAFSSVPYEKGHTFLFYLEQLLGGPDIFEKFLREYVDVYKYKSIDTDVFKNFLLDYFKDQAENLKLIDWDAWLYSPGMPIVKPDYDTTLAKPCISLCELWCQTDDLDVCSSEDIKGLSSHQLIEFLALLLLKGSMPVHKLEKMTNLYGFRDMKNCEIKLRWLRLGLISHWEEVVPIALQFVTEQGRMKYVRPIYRDLYAWEEKRDVAIATFQKHRHEMMYVSAYTVSKDLHLNTE